MADNLDILYGSEWFANIEKTVALLEKQEQAIKANNDALKSTVSDMKGAKGLEDLAQGQTKVATATQQMVAGFDDFNAAIKQAEALKAQYNGSTKEIVNITLTSAKATKELAAAARLQAQANGEVEKQAKTAAKALGDNTKEVERARLAEIKLAQQREKAFDNYEKKLQKQAQAETRAAEQRRRNEATTAQAIEKARKDEDRATKELANDYEILKKAYADASDKAKQYGVTLGTNSPIFKAAAADAQKMNAILYGVESAVGQNQRNVGNYKSGFSGLSNSIQQILREAPAAAISLNTFFLAISNNLPIFFDEIQKINKAQREANTLIKEQIIIAREAATAQALATGATEAQAAAEAALAEATVVANAAQSKAPSLLAQIGKSLFSVNTLLTLLVLGLTLFGGKIAEAVEGLFSSKSALEKEAEALEKSRQALDKWNKKKQEQIDLLEDELNARKELNSTGTYDVKNQTNSGGVRDLERQLDLLKAQQASGQNIQKDKKGQIALDQQIFNLQQKITGEKLKEQKFATGTVEAYLNTALNKGNAAGIEAYKFRLAEEREKVKDLENELKVNELRFKQQQDDKYDPYTKPKTKKKTDFTNAELKAEEDYTKAFYDQLKIRAEIEADKAKEIAEDETNNLERRAEAYDKFSMERIKAAGFTMSAEYDIVQQKLDKIAKIETKTPALRTDQEKRLLLEKTALEQQQLNIVDSFELAQTKVIADNSKFRLDLIKKYGKEAQDAIEQAQKNLKGVGDFFSGSGKTQSRDQYEAERDKQLQFARYGENIANSGDSFLHAQSEARIKDIDKEIAAIEKRRDAQIAAVNEELISEDEKKRKIAAINAKAQAETDRRNDKIRAEQRKDAQRHKLLQISQMIIDGAAAVVALLKTPPLAIAAGIAAAAEIALAIATPIPEFRKGGVVGQDTMARVSEEGSELGRTKDGKWFLTPPKETVTYLEAGTKIYPHAETMNIMKHMAIGIPTLRSNGKDYPMDEIMEHHADKIVSAINRKRFPAQSAKPAWYSNYHTKNNQ